MATDTPLFTLDAAHSLLAEFDIGDDPDAHAFLAELLASGTAPKEEVDVLCRGTAPSPPKRPRTADKDGKRRKTPSRPNKPASNAAADEAGKSPFFEDRTASGVEGTDSSENDDGRSSRRSARPSRSSTHTLAIITRRTVVGGSPVSRPADSSDAMPKPLPPRAASPSPKKQKQKQQPSLFLSPSSSPSKRTRLITSPFFTGKRRIKTDSSESDSGASARTESTPSPTKSEPKQRQSRRGIVSALPFPPLDSPSFGLVQEQLADEPFWLLVALVFLTRVAGRVSLPVFWAVKAAYPTPARLLAADRARLIASMRHLGMSSFRCAALQRYARRWIVRPPQPGVVTTVKHYPPRKAGEETGTDTDSQWEIGHITQGAYAVDSWRIFCRDRQLGLSTDWKGDAGIGDKGNDIFQPEWMRVLPQDKELRACLRWMWMREGWDWDPNTGDRTVLGEDLRRAVNQRRVGYNSTGELQIVRQEDEAVV